MIDVFGVLRGMVPQAQMYKPTQEMIRSSPTYGLFDVCDRRQDPWKSAGFPTPVSPI